MKVVVFGASGTIGRPLLAELGGSHDVVAVSRRERAASDGVTWKTADATQRDSVARVLEGCEVAYYLVHSLGSADFEEVDLRAAETTALAAESAGVKQLVYLGGLGDDSADLSPHLRSRRETGAGLASTSVPVTTLRAAMVRPWQRRVRDDRRFGRPTARDGDAALGVHAHSTDRTLRHRRVPRV
jgi:uncharacterized protein YbjT (DUF2867 family)